MLKYNTLLVRSYRFKRKRRYYQNLIYVKRLPKLNLLNRNASKLHKRVKRQSNVRVRYIEWYFPIMFSRRTVKLEKHRKDYRKKFKGFSGYKNKQSVNKSKTKCHTNKT